MSFGIGQADTRISADIVIISEILGGLTHHLAIAVCCDTGGLILRIHYIQIKSCRKFTGELGGRPAYQFASFFGFTRILVDVINDLTKGENAGHYLFCHNKYPPLYGMCLCTSGPQGPFHNQRLAACHANRAAPRAPLY